MRKLIAVAAVLLSSVVCLSAETLAEFDQKAEQQLRALDPGAVGLWKQANAARDAEKHADAVRLYSELYARVPKFTHALRRMAHEELELGDSDSAMRHFRMAVDADPTAENLAGLASGLLQKKDAKPDDYSQAVTLAIEAEKLQPDDLFVLQTLAQAAVMTEDLPLIDRVTAKLEKLAPNESGTHYLRFVSLASAGDFGAARTSLDRARDLGLPAEAFESALTSLNEAMPLHIRFGKPALGVAGAWFGGFALLLLAGVALSRVAMRAAQQAPAKLAENTSALSGRVRAVYSGVLTLSCFFYYLSIPIVLLLVLGLGGALIYGFFAIGHVPIKLVILVVIVVGVSVWSMIKSLFIRVPDEDPGTKLDVAAQPRLRKVLDDVAAQIGTRAVDNVYLTPGTDVAVMERGKRSRRERCLILGIAALDGLRLLPFKAVLGHEYGHFSNRDTAGGAFALSVRRSMHATAFALAQGGAAAWYNPAWLFVNGFNRVFLRISEGASRLQEVLADRWAVFAYGAAAFEEGLRHVIARSVSFDAHAGATIKEVVDRQLPLANLYTYTPSAPAARADVDAAVEAAVNAEGSVYDSHPPAAQRFALAHALPQEATVTSPDDDAPAWSLFESPEALQHQMTAQVRANVAANYGVRIVAPE